MSNNKETRLFDILNPKLSTICYALWGLFFLSIYWNLKRIIFREEKKELDELDRMIEAHQSRTFDMSPDEYFNYMGFPELNDESKYQKYLE